MIFLQPNYTIFKLEMGGFSVVYQKKIKQGERGGKKRKAEKEIVCLCRKFPSERNKRESLIGHIFFLLRSSYKGKIVGLNIYIHHDVQDFFAL